RGPVAHPGLATGGAVVGGEEEPSRHGGGVVDLRGLGAGPDVLDEDRARGAPVALPELLVAVAGAAVGDEEERASHGGEPEGTRIRRAGEDVLDQRRARRGAVGLPQLLSLGGGGAGEEDRAADPDQLSHLLRAARGEYEVGSGRRAVCRPEVV